MIASVLSGRYHAGTIDLGPLVRRWEILERLYAVTRDVLTERRNDILHARMLDEGQVAGHRVYQAAERYLAVAWDNHAAFRALIEGEHGVSMSAPWNLLRPTFEASFYVAWVLDPEESLERRRRGLRLEYLDEKEHRLYYEEALKMQTEASSVEIAEARAQLSEARQSNEASYRRDADALGLSFPPHGVVVLDNVGLLSQWRSIPDGDVLVRSTWRALSGHQHGRGSAMLRGGDTTNEVPGVSGVSAVVSVNDDAFLTAAHVTTDLHMGAVELLLRRSRPALVQP